MIKGVLNNIVVEGYCLNLPYYYVMKLLRFWSRIGIAILPVVAESSSKRLGRGLEKPLKLRENDAFKVSMACSNSSRWSVANWLKIAAYGVDISCVCLWSKCISDLREMIAKINIYSNSCSLSLFIRL